MKNVGPHLALIKIRSSITLIIVNQLMLFSFWHTIFSNYGVHNLFGIYNFTLLLVPNSGFINYHFILNNNSQNTTMALGAHMRSYGYSYRTLSRDWGVTKSVESSPTRSSRNRLVCDRVDTKTRYDTLE